MQIFIIIHSNLIPFVGRIYDLFDLEQKRYSKLFAIASSTLQTDHVAEGTCTPGGVYAHSAQWVLSSR